MISRLSHLGRSALADRRGATAVEFAIVAPIFLFMVFWFFEVSILMIRQQAVDGALIAASRTLRTGVAQLDADPETVFRNALCDGGFGWLDCATIDYDVRTYPNFAAVDPPEPIFNGAGRATNFTFAPGGAGQIMSVRVTYPHQMISPLASAAFPDPVVVRNAAVLQGEPWN